MAETLKDVDVPYDVQSDGAINASLLTTGVPYYTPCQALSGYQAATYKDLLKVLLYCLLLTAYFLP
jgi:hypothetical protein